MMSFKLSVTLGTLLLPAILCAEAMEINIVGWEPETGQILFDRSTVDSFERTEKGGMVTEKVEKTFNYAPYGGFNKSTVNFNTVTRNNITYKRLTAETTKVYTNNNTSKSAVRFLFTYKDQKLINVAGGDLIVDKEICDKLNSLTNKIQQCDDMLTEMNALQKRARSALKTENHPFESDMLPIQASKDRSYMVWGQIIYMKDLCNYAGKGGKYLVSEKDILPLPESTASTKPTTTTK